MLDLSRVLAGPLATMLLADFGARVVKVEEPGTGDVTRRWAPPSYDGESAYYLSVNRRKESAAVDLGTEAGAEFVRRWAARADVLVENFLPGALERRGLGVEALRRLNPRLVACSISGAGPAGPLAGEPGFDLLAQGASGLLSITGPPGGPPFKAGVAISDVLTAWAALSGILAGLVARGRDGVGTHVTTDLFSSSLSALVNVAAAALLTGRDAQRYGNAHPSIEPYRAFDASDGPFLLAVGTDRQFERLAREVLSRDDLADDPRFATNEGRVVHRADLVPILARLLAEGTREEWLSRCRAASIPAGPVAGVLEALRSPQAEALGAVTTLVREGHAPVPSVRAPIRFEGHEEPVPLAPPRLGEDTARLFAEVGLAPPGV